MTAAVVGGFRFSQSWLLYVFGVALPVGVGAQGGFIADVTVAKRGV